MTCKNVWRLKRYTNNFAALAKSQTIKSDDTESTRHQTAVNANGRRGMVLPFEQHSITFDEIKYSVDMPEVS